MLIFVGQGQLPNLIPTVFSQKAVTVYGPISHIIASIADCVLDEELFAFTLNPDLVSMLLNPYSKLMHNVSKVGRGSRGGDETFR